MSGIWAKSVLASRHSITGVELHTILARYPRMILAETNTHRVFSRNTASSRAIPILKMLEQVEEDPFIPEVWTRNQPRMQGIVETREGEIAEYRHMWLMARDVAVESARSLMRRNLHKQIVNRLIEPFMWTLQLITATEWENFDALRDHPAAEPHMQLLAKAIKAARAGADVQELKPGQWHLPFLDLKSPEIVDGMVQLRTSPSQTDIWFDVPMAQRWSTACCASTSYTTTDGFDMTVDRARNIWDKLKGPPLHASPFEHINCADEIENWIDDPIYSHPKEHRNFRGFRQLRAQIERAA